AGRGAAPVAAARRAGRNSTSVPYSPPRHSSEESLTFLPCCPGTAVRKPPPAFLCRKSLRGGFSGVGEEKEKPAAGLRWRRGNKVFSKRGSPEVIRFLCEHLLVHRARQWWSGVLRRRGTPRDKELRPAFPNFGLAGLKTLNT